MQQKHKEKVYIDTNVILRYLISDPVNPHLSRKSWKIFKDLSENKIKVYTNFLIISEIVYVLEKFYKISKKDIIQKLILLVSPDNFIIDNKEQLVSALIFYEYKNIDFEDAYTYFEMFSKGVIDIFTFDLKHFSKLEGINVL